jgi:hypothetical protein
MRLNAYDRENSVPQRFRRAREVESVRNTFSSKIGNGPNDPNIPHRNYLPPR